MYRMAQKIKRSLGKQPLQEVWFAFQELQPWVEQLEGQSVASVETRGKALLIVFQKGQVIYTHNQLYGRWLFSAPDRRPDTGRQLRLALSTSNRSALLYSASDIEVLEPEKLEQHPFIARVGLDLLSSGADWQEVSHWIAQDRFRGRQLGHLLLDQSFLAGVGNYLRSEILFYAGLRPDRKIKQLNDQAIDHLADACHEMMWRSVKTGGVTNDAERATSLKHAGWKRRDYRHYVFSRAGQACFACDTPIQKTSVSSRRLYYCPNCQV